VLHQLVGRVAARQSTRPVEDTHLPVGRQHLYLCAQGGESFDRNLPHKVGGERQGERVCHKLTQLIVAGVEERAERRARLGHERQFVLVKVRDYQVANLFERVGSGWADWTPSK
jgi:hypothetical protein